jgi:predicted RNA methylase
MIDFDRKMIGDEVRNQAFYRALQKAIQPAESTVTDIGAGTGILSFMASKLGAKNCYLYEFSEILDVAKQLAKKNNFKNCHFIRKHTSEAKSPVQTDIVVSETLGNFLWEEHLLENWSDAETILKPGGTMIPFAASQEIALVTSPRLYEELTVWRRTGKTYDIDLSDAETMSLHNMYVKVIDPKELLKGSEQQFDRAEFGINTESVRTSVIEWKDLAASTIYGFALWWTAELIPGVILTTSPHEKLTHWEQNYLPVLEPLSIKKGDSLRLTLKSDSRYETGINVSWTVEHNGKKQVMDMRKGRAA